MGDLYVELIATGSDESMMIVHALLEVSTHPEFDIALMDYFISSGDEASIDAEKSCRLQVCRPSYESLVALVSFKVQYPSDYAELSKEDQNDFKQTRYGSFGYLV